MSKHMHTPGPWEVERFGSTHQILADGGFAPRIVATAAGVPDAKLIAAAPDLAAACMAALLGMDAAVEFARLANVDAGSLAGVADVLRAALLKAGVFR